ncbi:DsbA family protein [Arcanobacterium phocae]|uniref:DsbA family protein n=1 Tax=Arcanobacterium phocae TaxID=131112 RepID=UPI001C0EB291|nr:thioredoxin domain-containing protein [Arcanobacterium phocae]
MNQRKVIASLVALLTVAALVISMIVAGVFSSKTPAAPKADSSSSTSEPQKPAELSPEVKKLIEQQHRLNPDDPRALGSLDAPVVIEMYSDYRCGHCRDWSLNTLPELQSFIDDGTVRIEYNSLPILGDESVLIAQASHAAALQNKFWEYHHELFANPPEPTAEALTELAGKVGMDTDKFTADLQSEETVKAVNEERTHGQALGISSTPSFIVGYSFLAGAYPIDQFNQIINAELKRPENQK